MRVGAKHVWQSNVAFSIFHHTLKSYNKVESVDIFPYFDIKYHKLDVDVVKDPSRLMILLLLVFCLSNPGTGVVKNHTQLKRTLNLSC